MKFIELIQQRYTTKVYEPTGKLSDETLAELKEILRLSPSSINSQPWHFTFVESEAAKGVLSEFSLFNAPKVENCSAVVVFSVRSSASEFEEWLRATSNEHAVGYFEKMVKSGGEAKVKQWMASQCYLALGVLLSACAEMGVDSTPMEGIECAKYDEYLAIDGYSTLFAVALGRRASDDFNQLSLKPKQRREAREVITTL